MGLPFFLLLSTSFALSLTPVGQSHLEGQLQFQKTRVAGLSHLQFKNEHLWALSDDRGKYGNPRLYKMKVTSDYRVQAVEVLILPEPKGVPVLDLEAFHLFNDGKFLFSSEGDLDKKPRVPPMLRFWDPFEKWGEELKLPSGFVVELTGRQTKGLQNNMGFEALAVSEDEKEIWVWSEASLFQNQKSEIEVLRFHQKQFEERRPYFRDPPKKGRIELFRGISDVQIYKPNVFFVLERWAEFPKSKILSYGAELFIVQFEMGNWKKTKLLTLEGPREGNWEGMALRSLSDGRKELVLVTDNNLEPKVSTQFLFYQIKE